MADTPAEKEKAARVAQAEATQRAIGTTAEPNVLVTADHLHREALAKEMVELAKNPISETVPGGKYIGEDGEPHDAEGRKLDANGEPIEQQETATPADAVAQARARYRAANPTK